MLSSEDFTRPGRRLTKSFGLRKLDMASADMFFADVAIETTTRELANRLYTYKVPSHLKDEVFVGSQVLVPFGHQELISGYVMSLRDTLSSPDAGIQIKSIVEILETEPLFDRTYVTFLHWVAEYYAASILDVINAAVPSDVGTKVRRIVRLSNATPSLGDSSASGESSLTSNSSTQQSLRLAGLENRSLSVEQQGLIALLHAAKNHSMPLKSLRQRSGIRQSRFYAALSTLRQAGVLDIERESESKTGPKTVQTVIWTGQEAPTRKQQDILVALKRGGGQMTISGLAQAASSTTGTIRKMCAAGILQIIQDEVFRDPLAHLQAQTSTELPELTHQQSLVLETLSHQLAENLSSNQVRELVLPWLLHGVTGSGKTEIYLRLIDSTLKSARSALMLVPEISLTPQLAKRLVQRFGSLVAIWHSGLSAGERFDTWRRLKAGQARVLLGARSAILANLPDLGLIILDEEHDASYKQSSPSPRYNAKALALERARLTGSLVLLGSATPDVVTYYECKQNNRIVELPDRVFKQRLPESVLIDMRMEFTAGNRSLISRALQQAISDCLGRKEQVILLINRRGYASHVFCRACGYVVRCRNCSVSLVFHQHRQHSSNDNSGKASIDGFLVCHHCAFTTEASQICPSCRSPFIRQFGLGTQRVEEEVKQLFPKARMLRLDSDITSKRGAYEEIFNQFVAGEADILIGTQIVAKGLDIPRVTIVGVLAADTSFNLPDYRSTERGFQLLTQVSGRAGRGHQPGKVYLQTYNLDLPALTLARKQDYASFFQQELSARQIFEYPPFSQIIRVVIAGEHEEDVAAACEQLAEELSTHLDDRFEAEQIKILGPAPCLIERLRGKYRQHLLIKNLAGESGRQAIAGFLRLRRGAAGLTIGIDVDAVDLF